MPSGVNKVILVGNLGADPEVRFAPSGTAVANFTIATSETRKDKDGNKETKTEWHRIVTFGKVAEICGEYLRKGKQVYLEGRIQTRSWDDKEGVKRYTTEIVCHQMQMLGSKGDERPAERGGEGSHREEAQQGGGQSTGGADFEDIPF